MGERERECVCVCEREKKKRRNEKQTRKGMMHTKPLTYCLYPLFRLKSKTTHRPDIFIVCGTGLGKLAELIEDPDVFE